MITILASDVCSKTVGTPRHERLRPWNYGSPSDESAKDIPAWSSATIISFQAPLYKAGWVHAEVGIQHVYVYINRYIYIYIYIYILRFHNSFVKSFSSISFFEHELPTLEKNATSYCVAFTRDLYAIAVPYSPPEHGAQRMCCRRHGLRFGVALQRLGTSSRQRLYYHIFDIFECLQCHDYNTCVWCLF